MINLICVKWGNRYPSKFVNRLRYMVSQNTASTFNFICLTDDPTGIEEDIQIILLPSNPKLEVWWNKLFLFQKNFLPEGKYLFFDLDVVIQNNIDEIIKYESDRLLLVPRIWDNRGIPNNSSIMKWETGQVEHIWEYFESDIELAIHAYDGIDGFMSGEKIPFDLFPKDWVYSYAYGDKNNSGVDKRKYIGEYMPEYKVCLMNGIYKHLELGHPDNPYIRKEYTQYMGDYV